MEPHAGTKVGARYWKKRVDVRQPGAEASLPGKKTLRTYYGVKEEETRRSGDYEDRASHDTSGTTRVSVETPIQDLLCTKVTQIGAVDHASTCNACTCRLRVN